MSDQPQFRPRVLPMPKVGDNVHLMGFHMSAVPGVVTAVDYGKRTFNVNTDGTERGHSLAFDDVRWNFADPAVEALRLQEAAWRADTSPLTALVRDVALLKDENILANTASVDESVWRKFRDTAFGTEPQTPEARKMLGLVKPEPEPVYEWHGNIYRLAGNTKGLLCYGLDSVIGVAAQSCKVFDTEAAARSWVEAQIKTPKP